MKGMDFVPSALAIHFGLAARACVLRSGTVEESNYDSNMDLYATATLMK